MKFPRSAVIAIVCLLVWSVSGLFAGEPAPRGALADTWEQVYARMKPWTGKHQPGVDASSLKGKVVCGYQGWFSAPGDGSGGGWVHYGDGVFKPGVCNVDFWPDMSEAAASERYSTEFRNADGSMASVFSSYNPQTVNRHFQWMAQYGIDGAFLQRFGSDLRKPGTYDFCNAILDNVRNAANNNGRTWVVMYDLSGLSGEEISSVIIEDWKRLVDRMQVRRDPSYQNHAGKPLVVIWGVGFNEGRHYSLKDCEVLMDFLKNDPRYGGNSIMLGVPYGWRELNRDAVADPELHRLIKKTDIVSPWAVTRYNSTARFLEDVEQYHKPDLAWCRENHVDYLPVIFPGFSWSNLMKVRGKDGEPHRIPRENGTFFWKQGSQMAKLGGEMIYVAMFDELDEGTAILKCSNHPPVGPSRFQTNAGVAPDHYLWLAGQIGRALRQEIPASDELPLRSAPVAP